MNSFVCPTCKTVVDNCNCGNHYCPNCSTKMYPLTNSHNQIEGYCSKCNKAVYLMKVNENIHYKCLKLDKTFTEPNTECQI